MALAVSLLLPPLVEAREAAIDWAHAQTLQLTMRDYRFVPDRLSLRRGSAYRLRFVNRSGKEWHEFTAPQFLRSADIGNPAALDAASAELSVPPHETRELLLVPRQPGRYRFYCTDHDWAGMEGEITVKP